MKRMTTIILFAICFLAIGSWSYAQCKGCGGGCGKGAGQGMNYVDKNGDGICDNAGLHNEKGQGKGCRYLAKNNAGKGFRKGSGYVDKDGNGVCDNLEQDQDKMEQPQ
jgi:hypothetical protein